MDRRAPARLRAMKKRGRESHPRRSHAKRRAPARARRTNMEGEEQTPGGMALGGASGERGRMRAVLPMGRTMCIRRSGNGRQRSRSSLQLYSEIPELEHIVSRAGRAFQHPARNPALGDSGALGNFDLRQASLKQRKEDLGRSAHAAIMHFCVISPRPFALLNVA